MAITGTTNTCQIITNSQFVLSGISESNFSAINIVDENGLDVSQCFGIETRIVTVEGDNITLTGDCDTSLEIIISDGVSSDVECEFTDYIQELNGLVTFVYNDNRVSDNVHPDCCTALGFTPEIGPKCYYVCRWKTEVDVKDCDNYQPTGTFDSNNYQIFNFVSGGTTTIVPSAECCYVNNLIETIVNGNIHCVEDIPFSPCDNLEIVQPIPDFGIIQFFNSDTNSNVTTVINSECCTSNGFSFQEVEGGFECFKTLDETPCNFDGVYYHYFMTTCENNIVPVRSTLNLNTNTGVVYQTSDSTIIGELTDINCRQSGGVIVGNVGICPQNNERLCREFIVTNVGNQSVFNFSYIACTTDDVGGTVDIPLNESRTICGILNNSVIDNTPGLSFQYVGLCGND